MYKLILSFCVLVAFSWTTLPVIDLTNTKWAGTLNAPDPVDAVLEFKKDSMLVYINNQVIETTAYQMKGDTLLLKKISGNSPCSEETGRYTYGVKADVLTLTAVQDDCSARSYAFDPAGYKKQSN